MKLTNLLVAFIMFWGIVCATITQAQESNTLLGKNDASTSASIQSSEEVTIVRDETPIRLRRGDVLSVSVGEQHQGPTQVRIHSSLGRLVKRFDYPEQAVSMDTDILQPGVYIVVIKSPEIREIRKVLLTD
ncbi:MAG: T9SS type A sorting domain-containing protein [Bacteroidia bacterium]|nr:T9SS type A sorting domain-containing protein [Bacteroidia bacterium]